MSSRQSSVRKPLEKKMDRFPLLDIPELSLCLKSCNLEVREEDLNRPTPIFVQSLFAQILDAFLSIPPSLIRARKEKVLNTTDEQEEELKLTPEDFEESLDVIAMHMILYRFLLGCGVSDFVLADLIKPDPQRTRRLLSAVVNFARFRDEHLFDNEQIIQQNNFKMEKHLEATEENRTLKAKIAELQARNGQLRVQLPALHEHNSKVESELRALKKDQETLANEHMNYKTAKAALILKLEDNNFLLLEMKKDLDQMRRYTAESPEVIADVISGLKASLKKDEQTLNELETRSQKLAITIETMSSIEDDLKSCLKIVAEIQSVFDKENICNKTLGELNSTFEGDSVRLSDIDHRIDILERNIKGIEEKMKRATANREKKRTEYRKRLDELNTLYQKVMAKKSTEEFELNKKKAYIEDMQRKIQELDFSFKREYDDTILDIQVLNSRIKTYLDHFEEKLQL